MYNTRVYERKNLLKQYKPFYFIYSTNKTQLSWLF